MKQILFIVCITFAYCTGQDKCSIYDSQCQRDYFQQIATQRATTGVPEAGIPVMDPYKLGLVEMNILGLWTVSFNGEAEGIGKCQVIKYSSNVKERYREVEVVCDKIVVRGKYNLKSAAVVAESCKWCEIHGDGYGTLTFEDWFFKFKYPFKMEKRGEEIYLKPFFENAVYEAEVKNVKLEANHIKLGKIDISKFFTGLVNHNTKLIMGSDIGKFINDKSAEYYYAIYKIFFHNVPANQFLNDDLDKLLDEE